MRAYGSDTGHWLAEDYGPPSRWAKLKSKHRKESRRQLHQMARRAAKKEIENQKQA